MIFVVLVAACVLAAAGQLLFKWGAAGNTTLLAYANWYIAGGLASYRSRPRYGSTRWRTKNYRSCFRSTP